MSVQKDNADRASASAPTPAHTSAHANSHAPPQDRLDSWKEIAAYLKRDERTVQRWERERGFPVHRTPGGKRGMVFAYAEELDTWLNGPAGQVEDDHKAAAEAPYRRSRVLTYGLLALAVVLLAAGIVAVTLGGAGGRTRIPHSVVLKSDRVVTLDEDKNTLWEYPFDQPLAMQGDKAANEEAGIWNQGKRWRLGDVTGDDEPEVLAGVHFRNTNDPAAAGPSAIFCFSADGKLLWEYKPEFTLTLGGTPYQQPWQVNQLLLWKGDGPARIWAVFTHYIWGASALVRLDPATGKGELQLVHSGSLFAANVVSNAAGDYLFVAGFNDEYDSGSLAVLKVDSGLVASPQIPGSKYECKECGAGRPDMYFVFPPSEINRLENPEFHPAALIFVYPQAVEVSTYETSPSNRRLYEFSPEPGFPLLRAHFSADYPHEHRRLEKEGRLDHSLENCPDKQRLSVVRRWTPSGGWRGIPVP
jgi:hypothetical protein